MEFKMWYIWTAIAILFAIGELVTAGFFLLPFGAAAAVSAVLAFFEFNFIIQGVIFVILSIIFFILLRKIAEKVTVKQPEGVGADRFIGYEGIVLEEIDNLKGTGLVKVGMDEWRGKSLDGLNIPKDNKIKVAGVEGTRLIVKAHKKEE